MNMNIKNNYSTNGIISSMDQLKRKIRLFIYFDIKKSWGTRILNKLKRLSEKKDVDLESKISQAKAQKFSSLSRDDIEKRLTSYDKIDDMSKQKKRKITQIAPNTFKIQNAI